jgi:putative transposase
VPRKKRYVAAGFPHHITQRGIRRSAVFFTDEDRIRYLERFCELTKEHGVEVLAYCLMTTHVHHLLVPPDSKALEKVFRPLHSEYALAINSSYDWNGHLWQSRYFSCALDNEQLINAIRYVELNPVRAGMRSVAENYLWSSAKAHVLGSPDPLLTTDLRWVKFKANITDDWSTWLKAGLTKKEIEFLRLKTNQGLPCGSQDFVKLLEEQDGICLSHKPPGRPKK